MSALHSGYIPSWRWLGLQGVEDLVGDVNSLPTNKQTLSESQVEPTTWCRVDSPCHLPVLSGGSEEERVIIGLAAGFSLCLPARSWAL